MSAPEPIAITSPFVPDRADVRAWIEKMIKALRFAELVTAIVALITRMGEINLDLTTQLANLRRARPRSETWKRLEGQHLLPFMIHGLAPTTASGKGTKKPKPKTSRKGRHPGRAAPPPHLPRVETINAVPRSSGFARCAGAR